MSKSDVRYDERDDNGTRLLVRRFTRAPLAQLEIKGGKHAVLNLPQLVALSIAIDDLIRELDP